MPTTANNTEPLRRLPGTDLAVPRRPRRDLGAVIQTPNSADLIAGVEIEPGTVHPDDRGFFTELFRPGADRLTRDFPATLQISAALSYPGTIKAWHYHCRQIDVWVPVRGQFQMVLCDLRPDSPNFGRVNTIYGGEWRPWRMRIPSGVAHGYKVVGTEAGLMVYATNRHYDPADEGRIAFNDAGLNYDWETQYK